MQESSTAFDHQQPSKIKKRTSAFEGDGKDLKSLGSKESAWASESFKLPEIRFVRKAQKTVRRIAKGRGTSIFLCPLTLSPSLTHTLSQTHTHTLTPHSSLSISLSLSHTHLYDLGDGDDNSQDKLTIRLEALQDDVR